MEDHRLAAALSHGTLSAVDKSILRLIQSQYAELYAAYSGILKHTTKEWQAQTSYYAVLQSLVGKQGPYLDRWWPRPSQGLAEPEICDELAALKQQKARLKAAMARFDKDWRSCYQAWLEAELRLRMARERHGSSLVHFLQSALGNVREPRASCSGPWSSQQSLLCSHDAHVRASLQSKSFLLDGVQAFVDCMYPQSRAILSRSLRSIYEKKVARLEREKEFYHTLLANVQRDEQSGAARLERELGQILRQVAEPHVPLPPSEEDPLARNAAGQIMSVPLDRDFAAFPNAFACIDLGSRSSVAASSFYSVAAALSDDCSVHELDGHFGEASMQGSHDVLAQLLEEHRQQAQAIKRVSALSLFDLVWQQSVHSLPRTLAGPSSAPLSPVDFSASCIYSQLEQQLRRVYRLESRLSAIETPFSTSYHFHVLRIGILSRKTRLIFQYWKKTVVVLSSDSFLNVYYCQSSELEQAAEGSPLSHHERLLSELWHERHSLEPDESYDLSRGRVQVKALPLELCFELGCLNAGSESSSEKCVQGLASAIGSGSGERHHLKCKSEHIDDLVDWVVAIQDRIHAHASPGRDEAHAATHFDLRCSHEPAKSNLPEAEAVMETPRVRDAAASWSMPSASLDEPSDPWQS